MEQTGQLRLELVDVYGRRLKERVTILLRNMTLTDNRIVKNIDASKRILITSLFGDPNGQYRIEVDPPSYLTVSRFVNVKAEGITELQLTFPVDPDRIMAVRFPGWQALKPQLQNLLERSNSVLGFTGKAGQDLFNALDDTRRAALLNISAKCEATLLANGRSVLSYIESVKELRGDRFFASVPQELREETKNSIAGNRFYSVSGRLHHPPAEGFEEAGSFKTPDPYGNLQLTFFALGNTWLADIDIDDAAGIEHVFQVLQNVIMGPTQPYNIHEILLGYQKLDPGYELLV